VSIHSVGAIRQGRGTLSGWAYRYCPATALTGRLSGVRTAGPEGPERTISRARQTFEGLAVALLLLLTATGDATLMLGAAVVVLVAGLVAFPRERPAGLTTAAIAALVALALALVARLAR
jgi:hypothetical protein